MTKAKNVLIALTILLTVGMATFFNTVALSAAQTGENSREGGYTVSGYVTPDFAYNPLATSKLLSGFKVELSGTQLSASSDSTGYFEIKDVPELKAGYTVKITKIGYLAREAKNVPVTGNLQISAKASPVRMWAGDMNADGAVNISDVMLLASAFNTNEGNPKYEENYDLNGDTAVNISDIMIVVLRFNKSIADCPDLVIEYPSHQPSTQPSNTPTHTPTPTSTPTQTPFAPAPSVEKIEDSVMTYSGLNNVSYGGYLNGESFQQDGIISYNGYQYTAFWNTNKHVVMCKRKLPDGGWSKFEFADYTLSAVDAHNTISIGICPGDGTIHLAFDHHGSDLHYRVSSEGLATNPDNFKWDATSFKGVTSSLTGSAKITMVTYPRFITEPSKDKMLFEYRYGSSGSGDQILFEYDGKTHNWTPLGKYIDGISMNNNAYAHGINYDKNGRLHETWCWRETPDASTNHDLMYIYSDDNGRTWKNNDGKTVSVTGTSFINSNTQGVKVWTINQNRGLINQEAQAVDNNGQIHVLLSHLKDSYADESNFTTARTRTTYFHYWRDLSGKWHRTDTGINSIENFRGNLAFSTTNNIYAVLPNIRIAAASAASGWSDWKVIDKQDSRKYFSDPLIDTARLQQEADTLTLFCPVESSVYIYNLTYRLK